MRSVSPLAIVFLLSVSTACAPEGSSAYVSRNVPVDATCRPSADGDIGIATGLWDIGSSAASAPTGCVHSYFMNLVVNSNLKANARDSTGRAEPNILLITHADVRLMDKNQATLPFTSDGAADRQRPNPYRVQTAAALQPTTTTAAEQGVVEIEAIPKVYAEKLKAYDSILLEVQVFGTTTGDVDVEFRPFLYPLGLCRGCLSYCQTYFEENEAALTNLLSGGCNDNAAQDDRICVSPDC